MLDYTPVVSTTQPPYVGHVGASVFYQPTDPIILMRVPRPAKAVAASGTIGTIEYDFVAINANVATLEGLQRLRSFEAFGDNWDAEGAPAPNPASIETATKVFALVSRHSLPQVVLNCDGQPMMMFEGKVRGEIVVPEPEKISYFFVGDDTPFADEEPFTGSLPQDLVDYLLA